MLTAVACCFIQTEAQAELCLIFYYILRKLNLLKCFKCLNYHDPDYIQRLKRSRNRLAASFSSQITVVRENNSVAFDLSLKTQKSSDSTNETNSSQNVTSRYPFASKGEEMVTKNPSLSGSKKKLKHLHFHSSINEDRKTSKTSDSFHSKFCPFLFSNYKNDFYQTISRRRSTLKNTFRRRLSNSIFRPMSRNSYVNYEKTNSLLNKNTDRTGNLLHNQILDKQESSILSNPIPKKKYDTVINVNEITCKEDRVISSNSPINLDLDEIIKDNLDKNINYK